MDSGQHSSQRRELREDGYTIDIDISGEGRKEHRKRGEKERERIEEKLKSPNC